MKKFDMPMFEKLLGEVAECFDKKPPTAAAVNHWFEALQNFSWSQVEKELRHWLMTKNKFPTIAEIFLSLNEKNIDERETKWVEQKNQESIEARSFAKTPEGSKILAQIRKNLSSTTPDSKTWAYKILDLHADGHDVPYAALRLACEVLRMDIHAISRRKQEAA